MKILVTGGAGFIGSHLCQSLLDQQQEVIVVDDFNDFYSPQIKRENIKGLIDNKRFKLYEVDIRDSLRLQEMFNQEKIEGIVHLAARAGVRPSLTDPVLYEEVNIKGTLNLLEMCRLYGIEKFIFGSSSSVYGVNSKLPFSEEDAIATPISPYATTKRAGELLCYTYSYLYHLSIICLRFFTVYGPRQRPEMAIHKFTRQIYKNEEITLFGNGDSKRDYTYIADIIDGINKALQLQSSFEIFNLGDSRTIELKCLIELIETGLCKKAKIRYLPDQPGDVPITYADISKAQNLLGYQPQIKIEEGIDRFIKWYCERASYGV
ncbi:MAG: GDP-mannose 4,6-dehydratase [Candidatus Desantisbacteria bacterium]